MRDCSNNLSKSSWEEEECFNKFSLCCACYILLLILFFKRIKMHFSHAFVNFCYKLHSFPFLRRNVIQEKRFYTSHLDVISVDDRFHVLLMIDTFRFYQIFTNGLSGQRLFHMCMDCLFDSRTKMTKIGKMIIGMFSVV